MSNVYFDLTREFNREGVVAALASGQAVVYYRLAMMSKDGDWILRESDDACRRVLDVLHGHGARYRPGAPLDPRWLRGGWSSHLEFLDERRRRVRCDFFTRPPRVTASALHQLFADPSPADGLLVVEIESLIKMKQTQRAKDYPVVGELARLLSPEREIELTTDPDRILDLAPSLGARSSRSAVRAAITGLGREEVVVALAREMDAMQNEDRTRVARYLAAAATYLEAFRAAGIGELPLPEAHVKACELAERYLPLSP